MLQHKALNHSATPARPYRAILMEKWITASKTVRHNVIHIFTDVCHLLPPVYVVRREVMFSLCPPFVGWGRGIPSSWQGDPLPRSRQGVPPSSWWAGTPIPLMGGTPFPGPGGGYPQKEQHSMYLLRGGRYASCVHVAGLSCSLIVLLLHLLLLGANRPSGKYNNRFNWVLTRLICLVQIWANYAKFL